MNHSISEKSTIRGAKAKRALLLLKPSDPELLLWPLLTIRYWLSTINYEPFDLKGWTEHSTIRGAKAERSRLFCSNRQIMSFHFDHWILTIHHFLWSIWSQRMRRKINHYKRWKPWALINHASNSNCQILSFHFDNWILTIHHFLWSIWSQQLSKKIKHKRCKGWAIRQTIRS